MSLTSRVIGECKCGQDRRATTVLHAGAVIIQYGANAAPVNHQCPEQQTLYLKYMKSINKTNNSVLWMQVLKSHV